MLLDVVSYLIASVRVQLPDTGISLNCVWLAEGLVCQNRSSYMFLLHFPHGILTGLAMVQGYFLNSL